MRDFIFQFASDKGYDTQTDNAGNIMVYAKNSNITLQSHYDMVCIGKAPCIETVVKNGWMSAKDSSLGADNGIGVAIMLYLIQKKVSADFLFTNDEEIGLIGANALELEIKTLKLLNIDSEEFGRIYIGCAGGEDIFCKKKKYMTPVAGGRYYEIKASACGGHSGVNIADDIPNAITKLCSVIDANESMQVVSIEGGERINAIPRYAKAVVWMPDSKTNIVKKDDITIKKLDNLGLDTIENGRDFARSLFAFAHGVRGWNKSLNLPQSSINLAKVSTKEDMNVELSARAMSNEDLDLLVRQTIAGWEVLGFECKKEGKYPAWKPQKNDFSNEILDLYKKIDPDVKYAAIHAGLECALFAQKFPNLKIASIGPTILDPHSDRERVDLKSVEKITDIIIDIINVMRYNKQSSL